MIDFFKDLAEAANSRIRSPFIGSIALVFFFANWKALAILFFSNGSIELRVLTFEGMISWWSLVFVPVALGTLAAIIFPWVRLLGAWVARKPSGVLRRLQHDESQQFRIYQLNGDAAEAEAEARLAEATERAKIDAAKRLEDARNVDPTVKEELIKGRKDTGSEGGETTHGETWKQEILTFAGNSDHGQIVLTDVGVQNLDRENLKLSNWSGSHRDFKEMRDLVRSLFVGGVLRRCRGYRRREV